MKFSIDNFIRKFAKNPREAKEKLFIFFVFSTAYVIYIRWCFIIILVKNIVVKDDFYLNVITIISMTLDEYFTEYNYGNNLLYPYWLELMQLAHW